MWKVVTFLLIIIGLLVGTLIYVNFGNTEYKIINMEDKFTGYAYSPEKDSFVILYKDPGYTLEDKHSSLIIPDDLFQQSVDVKEPLVIKDEIRVNIEYGKSFTFYLVRTRDDKYGYIPGYRVATEEGAPYFKAPQVKRDLP